MKHFDRQINRDFSNAATLCAGSVYPITGGNDSSKDYWRVTKDKDGKVVKIENDGSNNVTTVDENGKQTGFAEYKTGTSRTGLLASQIGMNTDETNLMLKNARYSLNQTTGLFEGVNAKQAFDITGTKSLLPGNMDPTSAFYYQMVVGYKKDYAAQEKRNEIMKNAPALDVNSQPLTSELIEGCVGLPADTACFIATDSKLTMAMYNTLGRNVTNQETLAALKSVKGDAFDTDGNIINPDLLSMAIMDAVKGDMYLQYSNQDKYQYITRNAVVSAGYKYYSEIRTNNDDPNHEHCMAWINNQLYDPETSTSVTSQWWKDPDKTTVRYYGFKPTRRW